MNSYSPIQQFDKGTLNHVQNRQENIQKTNKAYDEFQKNEDSENTQFQQWESASIMVANNFKSSVSLHSQNKIGQSGDDCQQNLIFNRGSTSSENYCNEISSSHKPNYDPLCCFCNGKKNSIIDFLRQKQHLRYFNQFNFYFAKPINEILNGSAREAILAIKEIRFDIENEYLKRYYRIEEVPSRLSLLANFFATSYKPTRPNLNAITPSTHTHIRKWNYKHVKLFLRNIAKHSTDPYINQNQIQEQEPESNEEEPFSQSLQNNLSNNGTKNGLQRKRRKDLPSRVLNSDIEISYSVRMKRKQADSSSSSFKQSHCSDPEYENYRNFILQMSFESSTHNIYSFDGLTSKQNSSNQTGKEKISKCSFQSQIHEPEQISFNSRSTSERILTKYILQMDARPNEPQTLEQVIAPMAPSFEDFDLLESDQSVHPMVLFSHQKLCQDNYRSSSQAKLVSPNSSSSGVSALICPTTRQSIQQVQQYILSRIKQSHDCVNNLSRQCAEENMKQHETNSIERIQQQQELIFEQKENDIQRQSKNMTNGIISPSKKQIQSNSNKQQFQEQSTSVLPQSNKKSLNDRNFTQINLASVFESLHLSNRLASLEGKQFHGSSILNSPDKPIDLLAPVQSIQLKSTHSRHNSSQKRIDQRPSTSAIITSGQAPTHNTRSKNPTQKSPLGLTPRDFTKKQNSNQQSITGAIAAAKGSSPIRQILPQSASSSIENMRTTSKVLPNPLLSSITVDIPQSDTQNQAKKKVNNQILNSRQTKIVSLQENTNNQSNSKKRTNASPPGPSLLLQAKGLKIPKLNESNRLTHSPQQQGEETSALLSDRESKQRLEQQYSARLKTSISPKQQPLQLHSQQVQSTAKLIDSKRGSKGKVTSPQTEKPMKIAQQTQIHKKAPHSTYYRLQGASTTASGSQSAMWAHHNSTPHIMSGISQDILSSSAFVQPRPQDASITINKHEKLIQNPINKSNKPDETSKNQHPQFHLSLPFTQQLGSSQKQNNAVASGNTQHPGSAGTGTELSPRIIESVQAYSRQIIKKPTVSLQQQQMSKLKQLQSRQKLSNPAISYEMNSTNNIYGEGSVNSTSNLGNQPNQSKISINSSTLQRNSNANYENINSSLLKCLNQYNQDIINKGNNSMMQLYSTQQSNQPAQKSGALTDRDGVMHGRIVESVRHSTATIQRNKLQSPQSYPSQQSQYQMYQNELKQSKANQQATHLISEGLGDNRVLKTENQSQLIEDSNSQGQNASQIKLLTPSQYQSLQQNQPVVFLPPNQYQSPQLNSIYQDSVLDTQIQPKNYYVSNMHKHIQPQQVYQVQQLINAQRPSNIPQFSLQIQQQNQMQNFHHSQQKQPIQMQTSQTEKSTSSTFETDKAFFSPNQLRNPTPANPIPIVNQLPSPASSQKSGVPVKPRVRQPQESKQAQLLQMQSQCEQVLSQSQSNSGFLSHRQQNTGTITIAQNTNTQSRKKSNEPPISSAMKKGIQSSRGSYQGQYSDFKSLATSSMTTKHVTSAQALLSSNQSPQLRSTHLSSQNLNYPLQQPTSFNKISNNFIHNKLSQHNQS